VTDTRMPEARNRKSEARHQQYDLIIFDCDGTLVRSEDICNQSLTDLVNIYSPYPYTLNHALENWAGMTLSDVLKMVAKEQDINFPPDMRDRYVVACNKAYTKDKLHIDGALDFVSACTQRTKICVGSNGERGTVFNSLELCGYKPAYFDDNTIFTRIQVKQGKPAPDLSWMAAEKMGASPARTLVIEDSVTGVEAGIAAGMTVWGFTGASHCKNELESRLKQAGAQAVFDSFIHMAERLNL